MGEGHILFNRGIPRKGLVLEHSAQELLKDLHKFGYHEVILMCDGEPALQCVQEGVGTRRKFSGKGFSGSGGAGASAQATS